MNVSEECALVFHSVSTNVPVTTSVYFILVNIIKHTGLTKEHMLHILLYVIYTAYIRAFIGRKKLCIFQQP